MTCDRCGETLAIGDWPFCPHGVGLANVIGDECDIWQENGFKTPRHFSHKSELRRALAEQGLEIGAAHAGPLDKHVARWVSVDLDAARILVTRPSERAGSSGPDEAEVDVPVTWTTRVLP